MKKKFKLAAMLCAGAMLFANAQGVSAENYKARGASSEIKMQKLKLTKEWDKVFPQSIKVNHRKVTFVNRFGITLAADLYEPKIYSGRLPAIAVCGAFGAVKEQISGLYAQQMAERGFLAIAFDPSFTGESGGNVRLTRKIFARRLIFFPLKITSTLNELAR